MKRNSILVEENILNNRLIAFLDVLGFSSLLAKFSLEEIYTKYAFFINEAKNKTFSQHEDDLLKRTNFEFGKFISDSLILISNPINDIYHVNNFVMAISHLLSLGFKNNFPLRGAIGLSDVILDDENGIVLSKELPLLLNEEKEQEWVGCSILNDALNIILNSVGGFEYQNQIIQNPTQSNLIQHYGIPYKNHVKYGYVINYAYSLSNLDVQKGLEYLIEPKRENTKKYILHYQNLPTDKTVTCPSNWRVVKTRTSFCPVILE